MSDFDARTRRLKQVIDGAEQKLLALIFGSEYTEPERITRAAQKLVDAIHTYNQHMDGSKTECTAQPV